METRKLGTKEIVSLAHYYTTEFGMTPKDAAEVIETCVNLAFTDHELDEDILITVPIGRPDLISVYSTNSDGSLRNIVPNDEAHKEINL